MNEFLSYLQGLSQYTHLLRAALLVLAGLFLVAEKPFQTGDLIQVGQTVGEVLSIDLLSVKLWTFDNLLVRIPNESLIKTEMTNLTRFPIRRFDMRVGVAYRLW